MGFFNFEKGPTDLLHGFLPSADMGQSEYFRYFTLNRCGSCTWYYAL